MKTKKRANEETKMKTEQKKEIEKKKRRDIQIIIRNKP
jgi:hypothetical protein